MALNQEQVNTREEYKKTKSQSVQKKDQKEKTEAAAKVTKRIRIRLIPIWLRIILLVIFMVIGLIGGTVVGYGVLGGGKVADVFKQSTWTHIIDLVDKEK
ncbi:DNA-directed RNA polymerase subunit beta [Neobacillus mesonae]|uniref:DNA-directed RNA polymerase subunit beta n=1 Tax=Neobacillus mesonae TaxID=1193713 RepID=UPI002572BCDB|nr:DNA-directed RNA polymerase subunit beta [Neobacillus mesonae]